MWASSWEANPDRVEMGEQTFLYAASAWNTDIMMSSSRKMFNKLKTPIWARVAAWAEYASVRINDTLKPGRDESVYHANRSESTTALSRNASRRSRPCQSDDDRQIVDQYFRQRVVYLRHILATTANTHLLLRPDRSAQDRSRARQSRDFGHDVVSDGSCACHIVSPRIRRRGGLENGMGMGL